MLTPMLTALSSSKNSCSNSLVVKAPMSFIKAVSLLVVLCLSSVSLWGQTSDDASTWSDAYLDSLALYWPDNSIENSLGAPVWNPKKGKRLSILVDIAYIDFAGEKHATRAFMQKFAGLPENILTLFAFSMSKAYTFYGQRCGALIALSANKTVIDEFS